MKKLTACGVAALFALLFCSPAYAAFTLTITQSGGNVVTSGSGSFNLIALTLGQAGVPQPGITPDYGTIYVGSVSRDQPYSGITGPTSFGTGGYSGAGVMSGSYTGVEGISSQLWVPIGYASGNALSGTATYQNTSFATLGINPGSYVYTWGTGANADSFTINAGVPEPSTWALLGLGAGVVALRWRQAAALTP